MERKNEPTRRPLSFVKTAVAPPPSREERTPLSFVKTAVASPTPISQPSPTPEPSPIPQPSPTPEPSPISQPSPVPGAILPDSDVANALRTSLVAAAFGVNSPTAQASFAGVAATFDVAALRDGKAPETLDLTVVDAALMDATRALETLASRLEPNFNPRADAALREVWTRLDAAVGATNDALRETFLTQTLNALNSTISRLKGGRLLTALLAKAAVECRFGRLAAALSTLNDVAATRCPLAQATQDKAFYWNRLRVAMEARDVLAALTGRPLWADFWRERAEFFKGWASSSPTPTAERDEAFEIWRATELLTTDLGAAEEALRRAAFGKTQALNVEAAALYEKTFGEKPSKPPKPKKVQTPKSRARRWLKLTAFAVALAFVAFYLWATSPSFEATAPTPPQPDLESSADSQTVLYRRGREAAFGLNGTKLNARRGFDLLTQAAESGSTDAKGALAVLYFDGCAATPPNFNEAFKLAKEASDAGNPWGQYVLGRCCLEGLGAEKDATLAETQFKAARAGFEKLAATDALASTYFALCLYKAYGGGVNLKEAARRFREAADAGLPLAAYWLAACYQHGNGVEKDLNQAFEWYRKGAEAGNGAAMCEFGLCYETGRGVEKDLKQAFEWYRKGAEAGNGGAMHNLGLCYENGSGVEKDLNQAFEWYRKGAEAGNGAAMCGLGTCYYNGQGVERDYAEAFRWYQKGAEAGDGAAMNNLGLCYEYGNGVTKNLDEAERWYRKAIETDPARKDFAERGLERVKAARATQE